MEILQKIIKILDFNFICGISSIIGLLMSIYLAKRTSSIQKTVNRSLVNERFRVNYKNIMENLKSTGMNAVRQDFPNIELIFEFETMLRTYQKNYTEILTEEENKDINYMLDIIREKYIPEKEFYHQLSKIVSKRPENEGDN